MYILFVQKEKKTYVIRCVYYIEMRQLVLHISWNIMIVIINVDMSSVCVVRFVMYFGLHLLKSYFKWMTVSILEHFHRISSHSLLSFTDLKHSTLKQDKQTLHALINICVETKKSAASSMNEITLKMIKINETSLWLVSVATY